MTLRMNVLRAQTIGLKNDASDERAPRQDDRPPRATPGTRSIAVMDTAIMPECRWRAVSASRITGRCAPRRRRRGGGEARRCGRGAPQGTRLVFGDAAGASDEPRALALLHAPVLSPRSPPRGRWRPAARALPTRAARLLSFDLPKARAYPPPLAGKRLDCRGPGPPWGCSSAG